MNRYLHSITTYDTKYQWRKFPWGRGNIVQNLRLGVGIQKFFKKSVWTSLSNDKNEETFSHGNPLLFFSNVIILIFWYVSYRTGAMVTRVPSGWISMYLERDLGSPSVIRSSKSCFKSVINTHRYSILLLKNSTSI